MVGLPPALRSWVWLSPGAGARGSAPLAGGGGCALLGRAIKGLPWFSSCCFLLFLGSDLNLPVARHPCGPPRAGMGRGELLILGHCWSCSLCPKRVPLCHSCPPPTVAALSPLCPCWGPESPHGVFLHLLQLVLALSSSLSPARHPKTHHQPWPGAGSGACTLLGAEEGSSLTPQPPRLPPPLHLTLELPAALPWGCPLLPWAGAAWCLEGF